LKPHHHRAGIPPLAPLRKNVENDRNGSVAKTSELPRARIRFDSREGKFQHSTEAIILSRAIEHIFYINPPRE
jgi:hypothetical protein